jgi:hypothetical protein
MTPAIPPPAGQGPEGRRRGARGRGAGEHRVGGLRPQADHQRHRKDRPHARRSLLVRSLALHLGGDLRRGLSVAECAAKLGVSVSSVKRLMRSQPELFKGAA